jgi:hypothetical protein
MTTFSDAVDRLAAVTNADFANGLHRTNFTPRLNDVATVADGVSDFAGAAWTSATAAAASEANALAYAAKMSGTSSTSRSIGAGSKQFDITSGDIFTTVGLWVKAQSNANPTVDYMVGQITASSAISITISVPSELVQGSGTHTDWTLLIVSAPGAAGHHPGRRCHKTGAHRYANGCEFRDGGGRNSRLRLVGGRPGRPAFHMDYVDLW